MDSDLREMRASVMACEHLVLGLLATLVMDGQRDRIEKVFEMAEDAATVGALRGDATESARLLSTDILATLEKLRAMVLPQNDSPKVGS